MKLSVGRADLAKKIIQMIVLKDSYYGDAQPILGVIKSLFYGSMLVCLITVAANKLQIKIWSVYPGRRTRITSEEIRDSDDGRTDHITWNRNRIVILC